MRKKGRTDLARLKNLLATVCMATVLGAPLSASALPKEGKPAPPIKVVTIGGQKVTLANYKGHVLLLDFFATWCEGCNDALPHLISLNKKYGKQGLQILGVDNGGRGDSQDVLRHFVREKQINYPIALVDDDVFLDYGVFRIPVLFVIDKQGVLVKKFDGFNPQVEEALETMVKTLLAQ
jgi:thiol-disulfide isomerase/thioredoxin